MNISESFTKLKCVTVRTEVTGKIIKDLFNKETKTAKGTGVILNNNSGKQFIITAEHNIYGKKDERFDNISNENINIYHTLYNDVPFSKYTVKQIVYSNQEEDIAILELNETILNLPDILLSSDLGPDEYNTNFHLIGYPNILDNDNYTFRDSILASNDKNKFKLQLNPSMIDSSGEEAIKNIEGVSGAGVAIFICNKIYICGIVTKILNADGVFNSIVCNKLNNLENKIENINVQAIGNNPELWESWIDDAENQVTNEMINDFKKEEIEHFENLLRKNTILYEVEEKKNKYTSQQLKEFILFKKKLHDAEYLGKILDKEAQRFERKVEKDYSGNVSSAREAKNIKKEIESAFIKRLTESCQPYIHYNLQLEMVDFKITEWLMLCALDFED